MGFSPKPTVETLYVINMVALQCSNHIGIVKRVNANNGIILFSTVARHLVV
jgi:hypothetical protein